MTEADPQAADVEILDDELDTEFNFSSAASGALSEEEQIVSFCNDIAFGAYNIKQPEGYSQKGAVKAANIYIPPLDIVAQVTSVYDSESQSYSKYGGTMHPKDNATNLQVFPVQSDYDREPFSEQLAAVDKLLKMRDNGKIEGKFSHRRMTERAMPWSIAIHKISKTVTVNDLTVSVIIDTKLNTVSIAAGYKNFGSSTVVLEKGDLSPKGQAYIERMIAGAAKFRKLQAAKAKAQAEAAAGNQDPGPA